MEKRSRLSSFQVWNLRIIPSKTPLNSMALELHEVFDALNFISRARRSDSKRQCSGYLAPWAVEDHSSQMVFPGMGISRTSKGRARTIYAYERESIAVSQHRQPASVTKNGRMLLRSRSYPELWRFPALFRTVVHRFLFASFLMTCLFSRQVPFVAGPKPASENVGSRARIAIRTARAWKDNLDSSAGVDSCPRLIGYRRSQARLARPNVAACATWA